MNVTSAVVLAAEFGDVARFDTALLLMGDLGLVIAEHSGEGAR